MDLGRSGGRGDGHRLKRGEDCGGILVDHGEKGARGSFRCPAPSFPMLDGVKAEAENVREASLLVTVAACILGLAVLFRVAHW